MRRPHHRKVLIAVLGGALLATACGDGGPSATETISASGSPTATDTPTASPAATAAASASPTPTTEPSPTTSPSPTPTTEPLVAGPTGLGAFTFGAGEAEVIAEMESRFGAPDADSGWVDAANSPFGVCPGATTGGQVRGMYWGRIRLLFSDANTDYGSAGTRHWMAYALADFGHGGTAPTTAAGVGLGSTAADLEAAYGSSRVTFHPADGPFGDRYTIEFSGRGHISGSLDAPPPDGVVTFVTAGAPCGE